MATKDLFKANVRWEYTLKKHSLQLKRNEEIEPDVLITRLIETGYTHSPHLSKPGSYKKDGENISIRTPFHERIVTVSFFDTILDEILLFDINGHHIANKDIYILPDLSYNQAFEEFIKIPPTTSGIFTFLQNTNVIFFDLDFWEPLIDVSKKCQKSIIFSNNSQTESISI